MEIIIIKHEHRHGEDLIPILSAPGKEGDDKATRVAAAHLLADDDTQSNEALKEAMSAAINAGNPSEALELWSSENEEREWIGWERYTLVEEPSE